MAQSKRVADYISDSENDMEIQPSSNTEIVKRKKKTCENGFHYAHTIKLYLQAHHWCVH